MEVISSIYNSGYNIKKFYLGSRELNLAYLGNQVIYDEVIGDNDLNYILYEFYGSDTLPNTVEAPVKRAILKGNTKGIPVGKNIFDKTSKLYDGWLYQNGNYREEIGGKFYTTDFIEVKPNTDIVVNNGSGYAQYDDNKKCICNVAYGSTTTLSNTKYIRVVVKKEVIDTLQIEYGTVSTNYEEPIFELQSVKMPVLTTTGKNLFNPNQKINQGYCISNESGGNQPLNGYATTDYLKILPNTVYANYYTNHIAFYDENKTYINRMPTWGNLNGAKITSPSNAHYVRIQIENKVIPNGDYSKIGFICGKYDYEPYKSNILTVNEDVTLRSNGDICDELNLLTRQLTQRIGEDGVVLSQEVVKTVDLTIVDQDGKTINKLNSFNGTTHVSTEVAENNIYPMVSLEVASELQAAMSKVAEDIELIKPVQNDIETTLDTQSNDIDSLLLATTELFEMFL